MCLNLFSLYYRQGMVLCIKREEMLSQYVNILIESIRTHPKSTLSPMLFRTGKWESRSTTFLTQVYLVRRRLIKSELEAIVQFQLYGIRGLKKLERCKILGMTSIQTWYVLKLGTSQLQSSFILALRSKHQKYYKSCESETPICYE